MERGQWLLLDNANLCARPPARLRRRSRPAASGRTVMLTTAPCSQPPACGRCNPSVLDRLNPLLERHGKLFPRGLVSLQLPLPARCSKFCQGGVDFGPLLELPWGEHD